MASTTVTDLLKTVGTAAFTSQFREVEFRSNLFPPLRVSADQLTDNSQPSWFVNLVKPTLVFRDHQGRTPFVIAPAGEATEGLSGIVAPLLFAAALIGAGYALGKNAKK